jgi:hypothetical protein
MSIEKNKPVKEGIKNDPDEPADLDACSPSGESIPASTGAVAAECFSFR